MNIFVISLLFFVLSNYPVKNLLKRNLFSIISLLKRNHFSKEISSWKKTNFLQTNLKRNVFPKVIKSSQKNYLLERNIFSKEISSSLHERKMRLQKHFRHILFHNDKAALLCIQHCGCMESIKSESCHYAFYWLNNEMLM